MRILAMSSLEDGTERVVDALEGRDVTIIAKEYTGSAAEMCERLSVEMDKGRYDYIVLVSERYVAASIEANKQAKLRAAVCDTEDEMRDAMVSGINVVIVKDSQKRLGFLALVAGQHVKQKPVQAEDREGEDHAAQQKQHEKEAKVKKQVKEGVGESHEEPGSGGRGLLGKLKSQLGIVE